MSGGIPGHVRADLTMQIIQAGARVATIGLSTASVLQQFGLL
jgi:hypothetical protein